MQNWRVAFLGCGAQGSYACDPDGDRRAGGHKFRDENAERRRRLRWSMVEPQKQGRRMEEADMSPAPCSAPPRRRSAYWLP